MAAEEQATGLLDQALGPMIQVWQGLPVYGQVAVVGLAGTGFLAYTWIQNRDEEDQLEATDWKEKWENMLKSPTENTGGKINEPLYKRSSSARKRRIGNIKRLDETQTYIGSQALFESFADPDKEASLKDAGELNVEAVTYSVVKGEKKLDLMINTGLYKLASIFSKGSNPQAEYYDLPLNCVNVTDQGVVIKNSVHLFKKDGIWQTASTEGQNRLYQLSWLDTHQHWQESLQKHPEFYSDLNMNVSGQKNIMNQKSKNMRQYKKEEKMNEKMEAMED